MKLATVSGVSFSNNVQRSLPAVVSKTAVGSPEAVDAAGFAAVEALCAGAALGADCVCAIAQIEPRRNNKLIRKELCIEWLLRSTSCCGRYQNCTTERRAVTCLPGYLLTSSVGLPAQLL